MISNTKRKALCSLLALGLLLASGLAPALRHTHGTTEDGVSARPNPGGELTARSTHWHLLWWGLSFEFESAPGEDNEPARVESGLMAVTTVDPSQALAVHADSPQPDHSPLLSAFALTVTCGTLAALPPLKSAALVRAIPLSDIARRERSGVQRI